ncbi:hypothetical protein ACUY2L_04610 [Corynebacterium mastitidis]
MSLAGLTLTCFVETVGQTWSWVLFYLVVGGATFMLNPTVSTIASDTLPDAAAAGHTVTLISSMMTLTAVLSAPVLALPAMLWGWWSDLLAVAALCLTAVLLLRRSKDSGTVGGQQAGYPDSFRTAACVPAERTAAFMGQLGFIAVYYGETFGIGIKTFSLVWSLCGLSLFLGNWFGGQQLRGTHSPQRIIGVTAVAVALAITSLTAAAHAIVAAGITTLLVHEAGSARSTVLSPNGTAQSTGVCVGATLVDAGLPPRRLARCGGTGRNHRPGGGALHPRLARCSGRDQTMNPATGWAHGHYGEII